MALDKKNGKPVWKLKRDDLSLSFSTPAMVPVGRGSALVVAMPNHVWSVHPATGKLVSDTPIAPNGNISPAIVVGDGTAYITGGYRTKGTVAVRVGGRAGSDADRLQWSARPSSYVSTPALSEGRLYFVTTAGIAVCLDAKTGNPVYEERMNVRGGTPGYYASSIVADGRWYVVTRRAGVLVLKAGAEFEQLTQNPPLDDSDFNGTPAVVGNQMFLRSNRFLYCLEAK